ncbi:YjcZ family sporulation protein [Lysinibacillus sp. RS5]
MDYSGSNRSSSRFALIVVLFILLIIVGASFMHY